MVVGSMWAVSHLRFVVAVVAVVIVAGSTTGARAQLSPGFYASTCPDFESNISSGLSSALSSDGRIGASLLRMHFHDCFVQGCDGSVLLDDTNSFTGEKSAGPNTGSLRGFDVVDSIKASLESICPQTVSCADILATIARDAVVAAGGPSWIVQLGRRDSRTANLNAANNDLPGPASDVSTLTSKFAAKGLDQTDMIALSGAHTFGKVQCNTLTSRLFGSPDPTINPSLLAQLQGTCPQGGSGSTTVDLDQSTSATFDNAYYSNLLNNNGVLSSDQNLESEGGATAQTVNTFSGNQGSFFAQFAASMVSMGNINPLTGSDGEIRTNCRFVN